MLKLLGRQRIQVEEEEGNLGGKSHKKKAAGGLYDHGLLHQAGTNDRIVRHFTSTPLAHQQQQSVSANRMVESLSAPDKPQHFGSAWHKLGFGNEASGFPEIHTDIEWYQSKASNNLEHDKDSQRLSAFSLPSDSSHDHFHCLVCLQSTPRYNLDSS